MLLPLHDEAPMRRLKQPSVTWGLIVITTAIFGLFQSGILGALEPKFSLGFGLIPSVFFGLDTLDPAIAHAPAILTPLTSLFLHAGWMHLAGNMLFLWVFGDNVEDALGHDRFLAFYLVTGIIAGLAFAILNQTTQSPLIGASGAVSGVLGAYLVLYPKVAVFGLFLNVVPVRIPALWFIGGWFAFQLGHALFDPNQAIAWVAHVFGVIAGVGIIFLLRLRSLNAVIRRIGK